MKRNLVVKKFGGVSVSSLKKIEAIARRLKKDYQKGEQPIVVVSAMSGSTNKLEGMAKEAFPDFKGEAYDLLLSSGEQVSLSLLSMSLEKIGVKNKPLLGHQAGIKTDSFFSKASIQSIDTKKLKQIIKQGKLPIIAGFQGVSPKGQITTLGRGGSDLTAVALAAALKLKTCEIYTDVTGVFTADPRLVPDAKKIKTLGFSEMMEMSYLGSKVLQIRSVEMGGKNKVDIHVRHSQKKEKGTLITNKESMEGSLIQAVAHDLSALVIKIKNPPKDPGFLSQLFTRLGKSHVFVDIISHSDLEKKARLSFSIAKTDEKACLKVLEKMVPKKDIVVVRKVAKISVVGMGMATSSGVAGSFFKALKQTKSKIYLVTTSEIKISAIIDEKDLKKSARALHKEFKLGK